MHLRCVLEGLGKIRMLKAAPGSEGEVQALPFSWKKFNLTSPCRCISALRTVAIWGPKTFETQAARGKPL